MLRLRVDFAPPRAGFDEDEEGCEAASELVRLAKVIGGVEICASVRGHDMVVFGYSASMPLEPSKVDAFEVWKERLTNARSTGYVCAHCLVSSPKDEWGPGRITCPRCGKVAPSAGESRGS